ncbi:hypothetical protein [Actinokineospora sp. HUAS TT18]|uniref:hypothetical protein n=1 Tax=Actinokineospora sp. HUAS TT18 TaxID=3447451 RepID=UPI003F51C7C0
MVDTLTLTAKSGDKVAAENEDGLSLIVDPGAEIVLTATAPQGTDAGALELRRGGVHIVDKFSGSGTEFTVTVKEVGKYTAKLGDSESPPVTVTLAEAEPAPGENEGDTVVEAEVGELDNVFLLLTGIAAAVGIAALIALTARHIRFINNLTAAWSEETFAVRSAGQLQFVIGMAGVGLLLGGLWLAALETRGRLRAADRPRVRGMGKEVGDAAVAVLKTMTRARGTIAVLFVGMVLALAALWAATSMATPDTEDEPKTPPSTTAPPSTTSDPAPTTTSP